LTAVKNKSLESASYRPLQKIPKCSLLVPTNFAKALFLLGLFMVPRENKNNAYAKFGGTNKEYYGIALFNIGHFRK